MEFIAACVIAAVIARTSMDFHAARKECNNHEYKVCAEKVSVEVLEVFDTTPTSTGESKEADIKALSNALEDILNEK